MVRMAPLHIVITTGIKPRSKLPVHLYRREHRRGYQAYTYVPKFGTLVAVLSPDGQPENTLPAGESNRVKKHIQPKIQKYTEMVPGTKYKKQCENSLSR